MISCARSEELQKTLTAGRWPLAASAELREHVSGCRSCAELVRVSMAFWQDRSAMVAVKRLDSPSLLWWRAQLRRRQVAMEKVSRPIWGAQIAAVAFAVLVAAGFGAYMLREGAVQGTLQGSLKTAMAGFGLAPMIVIGLLLVLAGGAVVYLTLEGE
jgi:hypothetical protein